MRAASSKSKDKVVYPPGTILQHLYLKERIRQRSPGTFAEVGAGTGHVSSVLLSLGWSGMGYDLNSAALARAVSLNRVFVDSGRFAVCNTDWLTNANQMELVDLVISSMVLEHLDDEQVGQYFTQAVRHLRPGGKSVLLVPGSPRHWGIEDEIAGHYRRYTIDSLTETIRQHGWMPTHVVGLTYPLINLFLGLSNLLVRHAEADKQALSLHERTQQSGDRSVKWKTEFPGWAGIVLNEITLRPAHWLQTRERFRTTEDALVIYCECQPTEGSVRILGDAGGHPLDRSQVAEAQ